MSYQPSPGESWRTLCPLAPGYETQETHLFAAQRLLLEQAARDGVAISDESWDIGPWGDELVALYVEGTYTGHVVS